MKCPCCETTLTIADRSGIEIDFCPSCRGVWLDRGELDKIIERSAAPVAVRETREYRPERHDDDDDHDRYKHGRKKRGGFLGEIFDF